MQEYNCTNCGGTFRRYPSQQRGQPYCSAACRAAGVGRRKVRPLADRFWAKVDTSGECWLWHGGTNNKGYGLIGLGGHYGPKSLVHRLSYEWANGPIPDGLFVCHNCPGGDNPLCVRPSHLFLGTNTDNMRDASAKGMLHHTFATHPIVNTGERSAQAKVTAEIVRAIRQRYPAGGLRQSDLANEYGISETAVRHILARRTWKDVV